MDSWDNPAYGGALAYQKTAALTAAIKLDIFTLIDAGAATSDALSGRTATSSRGIRILCDFLTVFSLLTKQNVTETGKRYLDRSPPRLTYEIVEPKAQRFRGREELDRAAHPRRGGSAGLAHLAPNHPIWLRFAKAMTPIARLTAKRSAAQLAIRLTSPPATVLDVVAAHGFYGIELARALPEAVVTAVDWPDVLEPAPANATDEGGAERFRSVAGNAFEVDWGSQFDLVILANLLHHFSPEECITPLRKVKSSLSPQGRACAIDFVPDEDRVSPPMQAMFAFWMLATTPGGDAYTLGYLDEIARAPDSGGRQLGPAADSPVVDHVRNVRRTAPHPWLQQSNI